MESMLSWKIRFSSVNLRPSFAPDTTIDHLSAMILYCILMQSTTINCRLASTNAIRTVVKVQIDRRAQYVSFVELPSIGECKHCADLDKSMSWNRWERIQSEDGRKRKQLVTVDRWASCRGTHQKHNETDFNEPTCRVVSNTTPS